MTVRSEQRPFEPCAGVPGAMPTPRAVPALAVGMMADVVTALHGDASVAMAPVVLFALAIALLFFAGCRRSDLPAEVMTPSSDAVKTIVTSSGVEMVLIPAGELSMGDDRGEDDEKPAHHVQLDAFYMDACEVTQQSYQALMGKNPAKFSSPQRPVERVSWLSAIQYCNMRSLREGLKPCYDAQTLQCDFTSDGYRLPTEAQWEYACRAGTTTRWSCGDDPAQLGKCAWTKDNAEKQTHPVKQKSPNAWGLYDMHGNVAEWCNDYYGERYSSQAPSHDPQGPANGEDRVLRGGSWAGSEQSCRSAARAAEPPGFADVCFGYEAYGFRCVRKASSASSHAE